RTTVECGCCWTPGAIRAPTNLPWQHSYDLLYLGLITRIHRNADTVPGVIAPRQPVVTHFDHSDLADALLADLLHVHLHRLRSILHSSVDRYGVVGLVAPMC